MGEPSTSLPPALWAASACDGALPAAAATRTRALAGAPGDCCHERGSEEKPPRAVLDPRVEGRPREVLARAEVMPRDVLGNMGDGDGKAGVPLALARLIGCLGVEIPRLPMSSAGTSYLPIGLTGSGVGGG